MGYTKSLARQEYEKGTADLLVVCHKAHRSKDSTFLSAREILYQAAIFKTCALLETYISTLVTDWFSAAKNTGQTVNAMPDEMKWYLLFTDHSVAYRRYAYDSSEWQAICALRAKKENRLFDGMTPLSTVLDPALILRGKKYPSVDNLDTLFKRLGVCNVFDMVDRRIRRSSKLILGSFLSIRQDIAHQVAPDLQYTSVREQVSNVNAIVSGLDQVLYSHVTRCNGRQCWKTAILLPLAEGS